MADDLHEVYAIRYGHHARRSPANFIDGDPHDILQPLDFFVWAIVGASGAIIVDTGFDEAMGKKRQREMIKPVRDGLAALGIAPESVQSVIAPGVTVHHIGGHSKGLQSVRVKTRRGYVVLAADATHLYAHLDGGRVFPITYNVEEVVEGYETLKRLASSPRHVVPGHDPLVLQ